VRAGWRATLGVHGTSLNANREGRSFGSSDQLTVKEHLPKYIVLRSLALGQAAIVGTLDGVSEASVHAVNIGDYAQWMRN
jgi:hypothetical protein